MKPFVLLFLTLLTCPLFASLDESIFRVEAFLRLKDPLSASLEAREGLKKFPNALSLRSLLIRSFAESGEYTEALKEYKEHQKNLKGALDPIDSIAWSLLTHLPKGSSEELRITSLIGSCLTHHVEGVEKLLRALDSPSPRLRLAALQMALNYRDQIVKEKIKERFFKEKHLAIRPALFKVIAALKIESLTPSIHSILKERKHSREEIQGAILTLLSLSKEWSDKKIEEWVKSPHISSKILACHMVKEKGKKEYLSLLLPLLNDPLPTVRIHAMESFFALKESEKVPDSLLEDSHPLVSLMASFYRLPQNEKKALPSLEKALLNPMIRYRLLAAKILGMGEKECLLKALNLLKSKADPFFKVNLARSLLHQGIEKEASLQVLQQFLQETKGQIGKLVFDKEALSLIVPLRNLNLDAFLHNREEIDQITRLELAKEVLVFHPEEGQKLIQPLLKSSLSSLSVFAFYTLMRENNLHISSDLLPFIEGKEEHIKDESLLFSALFLKSKESLNLLKKRYAKGDWRFKMGVLEAFGNTGTREDVPFLKKALYESSHLLKLLGASALLRANDR